MDQKSNHTFRRNKQYSMSDAKGENKGRKHSGEDNISYRKSKLNVKCENKCPNGNMPKTSSSGRWRFPLIVFIGGTVTAIIVTYLIKKGYEVLYQPKLDDEISWYNRMVSYFINVEATTLSITDTQFYLNLYNSVIDDFYLLYYKTYQLFQDALSIFLNFCLFVPYYVAMVCALLCILYATIWLTCLVLSKTKRNVRVVNKNISRAKGCDCDRIVYRTSYWSIIWSILAVFSVFAFLVSVPWEYVRLYQHSVAEKISSTMKGLPDECQTYKITYIQHIAATLRWYCMFQGLPEECQTYNITYIQHIASTLRWYFSSSPDICVQYHKAVYVDPFYEVNPAMAITSVISNSIVVPFENICAGFGRGFRLFLAEIPIQWQPVILITFLVLLIIISAMLFNYKLNLFGFSLEPKTPIQVKAEEIPKRKKCRTKALKSSDEPNPEQRQLTYYGVEDKCNKDADRAHPWV